MSFYDWNIFLAREVITISIAVILLAPVHKLSDRLWYGPTRLGRTRLQDITFFIGLSVLALAALILIIYEYKSL